MFTMKVTPEDGDEFVVVCTSRDIAQWERANKGASMAGLVEHRRMTDFYKITFNAARRLGKFTGTLPEFENGVDLEEIHDTADEGESAADPSLPGA